MFDKANFQQRLAAMESSIDRLNETTREELAQIRSILLRLVKTQARMVPPGARGEEDLEAFYMDEQASVNSPNAIEPLDVGDVDAQSLEGVRAAGSATLARRTDPPVSLTTRRRSD